MRTSLGKPIHQNLDLWLRSLESMFEKVHTSVNGRNNVLPQLQSLKLYQDTGTTIKVPEVTNGGNQLWQLSHRLVRWRRSCNTDGQELQLSDPATMDIVIHILLAVSPQSAGSRHWVIMAYLTTKIMALLLLLLNNNMKFSPGAI